MVRPPVVYMFGAVLGLLLSTSLTWQYLFGSHMIHQREANQNIMQPKQLKHNMTDEQLFQKASMVPRKAEYQFDRVPKVAFMFLTRGPLPLLPLWERFFEGHEKFFSVYVHAIPGYSPNVSSRSAFYKRKIPSEEVRWGHISLVDAERRLLANALLDFSNEYFVLLSESCIPVYNFTEVYKYLLNSSHSFVDSFDEKLLVGRRRYTPVMAPEIQPHQWRKGSQWFELSRSLAIDVVSDSKYISVFRKKGHGIICPEEHYVPTYLNMFRGAKISNRSVTWTDWSRRGAHPATFGEKDINVDFINAIRNKRKKCTYNNNVTSMCFLFARKFSASTVKSLLRISLTVMGY